MRFDAGWPLGCAPNLTIATEWPVGADAHLITHWISGGDARVANRVQPEIRTGKHRDER
jgi:hypothetical protein